MSSNLKCNPGLIKSMPKTEDNPLGINVLACPICMRFSFFNLTRSEAVKHFWECWEMSK